MLGLYLSTLSFSFLILTLMSSSSPPQPQNWLEKPLSCLKLGDDMSRHVIVSCLKMLVGMATTPPNMSG